MTTLAEVGAGTISELRELHARGLKDCVYATGMRCGADAGVVFPLAHDLDKEREALERSDDQPDEIGAAIPDLVLAMTRRYGYAGEPVTDLRTALRTPGRTLALIGPFNRKPPRLQHWQPGGTFIHAIPYRVLTPTSGIDLDPLGPMGYAGEAATPDEMEAFCFGASSARSFTWRTRMIKPTDPRPRTVDIAVGVQLLDTNGVPFARNAVLRSDVPSPFAVGALRAVIVNLTAGPTLLLVKATDCTDIRPVDVKQPLTLMQGTTVLWKGSI